MSNEVVAYGMDKQIVVTPEQLTLVKKTIFPNSTDDELKLYIYTCQRKGVHPLDKLIHPVKRGKGDDAKVTFQSGIDFMRSEAESTNEYNGQDEPEFEFDDPQHPDIPSLSRVRVYRKGIDRPFIGTATWKEFYPGEALGFQWRKMPRVMLSKCAEAQALRKAFPKKLADLYTPEEMLQSENPHTYAQEEQRRRSESVKPAPPRTITTTATRNDAPPHPADDDGECSEGIPISDKVEMALAHICQGDQEQMKRLLMEASRGGKDSGAFLALSKLSGANTGWLKRIYEYLEPMLHERQPGEDDA